MKHVKFTTVLLVLLAVVANITFAAGGKTAGRLALPQRVTDQGDQPKTMGVKAVKQAPSQVRDLDQPDQFSSSVTKTSDSRSVILTKDRAVPPGVDISGLSGTIPVGAAHTFKTIADIAFLMNIAAFSGPTVFELTDPSYTEAGVAVGPSSGISAVNTITIRPAAGNTACVVSLANNTTNNGGWVFTDAEYVTIDGTAAGGPAGSRNLTIMLTSSPLAADGGDAPVKLYNAHNFTVKNCIIPGNSPSAAWSLNRLNNGNGSVSMRSDVGKYTSNVTVDNCELYGGHFGVVSVGNFPAALAQYGVQDDNIIVTNNYVHDVTEVGINLEQVTDATVTGNVVKRVVFASTGGASPNLFRTSAGTPPSTAGVSLGNYILLYRVAGIMVWGDLANISNNLVDSVIQNRTATTFNATAYGIRVSGFGNNDFFNHEFFGVASNNVLVNNIVTRIKSRAVQTNQPGRAVGIEIFSGRQDSLYHNTVYHSGADMASNPAGAAAIGIMTGGAYTATSGFPAYVDVVDAAFAARTYARNNIIAINRTGTNGTGNQCLAIVSAGGAIDWRAGSNNNVLSNGSGGNIATTSGGTTYPSVFAFTGFNGTDLASQSNDPTLVSESDVHINPAGLSTADGTGLNLGGRVPSDYDGVARTTPPDIGALEGTGAGLPHDVKPVALVSPGAAGAPAGLPFSPLQATFLNLGGFTETSFPVNIHVVNPDASTADFPSTVTLAAGAAATVTIPGTWNPGSTGGTAVFTITTALGIDNYMFNDTVVANIPVAAQSTVPYSSGFETIGDRAGWFAQNGFGLGTTGGKLGGPRAGTNYYVTNPGAAGNGTVDAKVEYLYTPFFDMSSTLSATLSFYMSIQTEPAWDRAIMEYSIDTGATWQTLGALNDPNGINWYSTGAYQNAAGTNVAPDCWDNVTAIAQGFPADGSGANPPAGWSSNGDCEVDAPTANKGPLGYVLVALNLPAPGPTSPLGKTYVRFRVAAFTDAGTHGDGWAIDDFAIGAPPPTTSANYSGKVYHDLNGNSTFDGSDVGLSSVNVALTYYGSPFDTVATDVNGDFTFTNGMSLPGDYDITTDYTGGLITQDPAKVVYASTGIAATGKNAGYYTGSISGKKFNDINDNGADNSEPGLAGWTIEVHRDSATGTLAGSAVTGVGGTYSVNVLPGSYVVKEIAQPTVARQTLPASNGNYAVTVSGTSGSGTAVHTGKDFGNFVYGIFRLEAKGDLGGDGIYNAGPDDAGLISGITSTFLIKKGADTVAIQVMGNANGPVATFGALDIGSYTVTQTGMNASLLRTSDGDGSNDGLHSFSITAGSQRDTMRNLFFLMPVVSGQKFVDINGNGVKDGADSGLAGWTINVSGTMLGNASAITDASGNYSIDSTGSGSHTISEAAQAGWTQTAPAGAGTYIFTGVNTVNQTGKNFGNFANSSVSGRIYRERDLTAGQGGGEEGLSGIIVKLGTQGGQDTTDSNGDFSMSGKVLNDSLYIVNMPVGYYSFSPASGYYLVSLSSGGSASGQSFGLFKGADSSSNYRTFTAEQLGQANQAKPVKRAKPGKPAVFPNTANVIAEALTQLQVIQVGKDGQMTTGTKPTLKGYLKPAKQGDVFKTLNAKGQIHVAAASPLDFYNGDLKRIFKAQKSIPASKHDNVLLANLLALQVNLAASNSAKTPVNLGSLIYSESGQPFNGMTIDAIADSMDVLMVNWELVNPANYAGYNTVIGKLNSAFAEAGSSISIDSSDLITWNESLTQKLALKGVRPVTAVAYLKANPGVAAKIRVTPNGPTTVPSVFALNQNFPNPFNPSTEIQFELESDALVTLKIYNMLGQEMATLIDQEAYLEGENFVRFDASSLSTGVYLYRLVAETTPDEEGVASKTFTQVKKMMLVK